MHATRKEGGKSKPVAMVTGASSGVGREVAIMLARHGWDLALGARRLGALRHTAKAAREEGAHVFYSTLDLTDEASIINFYTTARGSLASIDALVSNAGATQPCAVENASMPLLAETFAVNALGPARLAGLHIGDWRQQRHNGHLLFISSENVVSEYPYLLPYGASKAAIEFMARGLRRELHDTQIRVTILRLGTTDTEFRHNFDPQTAAHMMRLWEQTGIPRPRGGRMSPRSVATVIAQTLATPSDTYIEMLDLRPSFS